MAGIWAFLKYVWTVIVYCARSIPHAYCRLTWGHHWLPTTSSVRKRTRVYANCFFCGAKR